MQSQANRDVVKNITSAAQLEGELQLSEAQHGVAVLDIYNAEWGHCKALSDTFRRLFTDAGDVIHLRFFSVECSAVLESLKNVDEAKAHRPQLKGMVFSNDTLAKFWKEMLEQRQNHSKPFFAFYKEGRMRNKLEGIDTPKICRIVHDLCKKQNAASEYITNNDVLNFWKLHFSPLESEVSVTEFARAVKALFKASAPELSEEDFVEITEKVQGVSGATVTAANLQSFVGDNRTVQDAFLTFVEGTLASIRKAEAAHPQTEKTESHTGENEQAAVEAEPGAEEGEQPAREGEPGTEEGEQAAVEGEPGTEEGEQPAREGEPGTEEGEQPAREGESQTGEPGGKAADEPDVGPPTADAAEAGVGQAETDTHENDGSVKASESETPPTAAVESPMPSPSLPEEGHNGSGVENDSGTPANAPHSENDTETPPGAVETHDQDTELPEDAHSVSPSQQPTIDAKESEGGDDGMIDEAGSSAPPVDTAGQDVSVENQIFTDRWVTVTEEEMRMWNMVAALPLHYPESTALMADLTNDVTPVQEALSGTADLPTLAEYLAAHGVSYTDINMMCIAADQKVGSDSLSYGKLSLILMSCDSVEGKGLAPLCETLLEELSAGTILKNHQPVAFTALTLSASDAYPEECFCYCVPETAVTVFEALAVDDVFILNALTPLRTAVSQNQPFVLRVIGLPKVIELATTDVSEDTVVLNQWYARLRVIEQGASTLTAHFVEYVCNDEFQAFLSSYTARLTEDEKQLDRKHDGTKAAEDEDLVNGEGFDAASSEPGDES